MTCSLLTHARFCKRCGPHCLVWFTHLTKTELKLNRFVLQHALDRGWHQTTGSPPSTKRLFAGQTLSHEFKRQISVQYFQSCVKGLFVLPSSSGAPSFLPTRLVLSLHPTNAAMHHLHAHGAGCRYICDGRHRCFRTSQRRRANNHGAASLGPPPCTACAATAVIRQGKQQQSNNSRVYRLDFRMASSSQVQTTHDDDGDVPFQNPF